MIVISDRVCALHDPPDADLQGKILMMMISWHDMMIQGPQGVSPGEGAPASVSLAWALPPEEVRETGDNSISGLAMILFPDSQPRPEGDHPHQGGGLHHPRQGGRAEDRGAPPLPGLLTY